MIRLVLLFLLSVPLCTWRLQAQDPQFSQFYANQLLLSPAFAGAGGGPRLAVNFRNQWPRIPNAFITGAASFDMPFFFGARSRDPRHGLGINIMGDQAGAGLLRKIDANLNYSFLLTLDRQSNHNIRMGVSAGIQQASVDFFRLQFPDQFNPDGSFNPVTAEVAQYNLGQNGSRIHEELGAGLIYFNPIFYFGGNVKHLSQPQQTFINDGGSTDSRLPMHIAGFTGVKIPLSKSEGLDGPTLSPAVMFRWQQPFTQIDLGMYANFDPIVVGAWYRLNDAVIFLVGVSRGIFSFGYSYDLTVSDLTNSASGGAHEVSLVVNFEGPEAKRRRPEAKMSCPRF